MENKKPQALQCVGAVLVNEYKTCKYSEYLLFHEASFYTVLIMFNNLKNVALCWI